MVERSVEKGENNKKRGANLALGSREWLKGGDKGADSDGTAELTASLRDNRIPQLRNIYTLQQLAFSTSDEAD